MVVAVLAGLACVAAPVQPTGVGLTDVLLRFAFAMVTTLAAARARRATWIILATGAVLLSRSGPWFVVALAAMALALLAAFLPNRRRLVGAVIAALALPALLRGDEFGFTGASALCVWIAVLPVLVSGYRTASGRSRERMHRIATAAVLVVLIGIVVFTVVVWWASHSLSTGSTSAESGLSALRGGHGSEAALELDSAAELARHGAHAARRLVDLPCAPGAVGLPAARGAVGGVGRGPRDRRGRRRVRGQGRLPPAHASRTGRSTSSACSSSRRRSPHINEVLSGADRHLSSVRSPWLVGPVRTALDRFSTPDRRHGTPGPGGPAGRGGGARDARRQRHPPLLRGLHDRVRVARAERLHGQLGRAHRVGRQAHVDPQRSRRRPERKPG